MKPHLLLGLFALLALQGTPSSEADDTQKGATPLDGFGCSDLVAGDEDWWRLRRNHLPSQTLYIDTGAGCLCACPQGDVFAASVQVYDAWGYRLSWHMSLTPGLTIVPLSNLPVGASVWLRLQGTPVGPTGWSPYRLLLF